MGHSFFVLTPGSPSSISHSYLLPSMLQVHSYCCIQRYRTGSARHQLTHTAEQFV